MAGQSPQPAAPPSPVRPTWRREGTVYLLGIDGLSMDVIGPMIEAGELRNLARVAREGCSGQLGTIRPTNSSLLWTTIATGCHHDDHGIDGFSYYRIGRRHLTRSTYRWLRKHGFRHLLKVMMWLGWMKWNLLDGRHIRRKPFWDIASEAGLRVDVVNWWHTWPAEPVNGHIVSDRLFHWRVKRGTPPETELTYPETLRGELDGLMLRPDEVPVDEIRRFVNVSDDEAAEYLSRSFAWHEIQSELRFFIALDHSCWRAFAHCLDSGGMGDGAANSDVAALYFRGPDIAQHCALRYMPTMQDEEVSDEDRRRFGDTVPQVYRMADGHLGLVLERMGPADTLIVASDHGFTFQKRRGKYGHARGCPPGVVYLYGPEFHAGRPVEGASVYDVMPTLLRLLGFPKADDMPGRCLDECLTDEWQAAHPAPPSIPTYGERAEQHDLPAPTDEVEERIKKHLSALGYFD